MDLNLTNSQTPIVVSSNTTAVNDRNYTVVANATFTDPSPVEGKGFKVFVRNGTAVIGGFSYSAKTLVFRIFHSGSWSNIYYLDYATIDANFQLKVNLSTDVNTDQASNSKYPSVKSVFDWAVGLFVQKNSAITGATKTKITYDAKGLVTSGADATTADIADSVDARYVTDAQLTVLGNTSGTNTGDQDLSGYIQDSDFSSHSVLAQQSGGGSPVAVTIGTNEILGRLSGGGADIEGLSTSEVKTLLSYTTADIADSTDKRYVTDANLTVIGNTSGTNTGDQTLSGLGGVATTRTITINGTTQDLSADRTFSAVMLQGSPVQSNSATGGALRYYGFSDNPATTVETSRRIFITNACTLKNFYIRTSGTQPATGSHVLTILKNGVATGITITIPAGSGAGVFSDTINSETFASGDEISIEAVNNASSNSSILVTFSIGSI